MMELVLIRTRSSRQGASRASSLRRRRLLMSARQRLTTVGEVVLDGLLSGLAAVAAVALAGAAALTLAVVLLGWWF